MMWGLVWLEILTLQSEPLSWLASSRVMCGSREPREHGIEAHVWAKLVLICNNKMQNILHQILKTSLGGVFNVVSKVFHLCFGFASWYRKMHYIFQKLIAPGNASCICFEFHLVYEMETSVMIGQSNFFGFHFLPFLIENCLM